MKLKKDLIFFFKSFLNIDELKWNICETSMANIKIIFRKKS